MLSEHFMSGLLLYPKSFLIFLKNIYIFLAFSPHLFFCSIVSTTLGKCTCPFSTVPILFDETMSPLILSRICIYVNPCVQGWAVDPVVSPQHTYIILQSCNCYQKCNGSELCILISMLLLTIQGVSIKPYIWILFPGQN